MGYSRNKYAFEKTPGIFKFFTLPLEIPGSKQNKASHLETP